MSNEQEETNRELSAIAPPIVPAYGDPTVSIPYPGQYYSTTNFSTMNTLGCTPHVQTLTIGVPAGQSTPSPEVVSGKATYDQNAMNPEYKYSIPTGYLTEQELRALIAEEVAKMLTVFKADFDAERRTKEEAHDRKDMINGRNSSSGKEQ